MLADCGGSSNSRMDWSAGDPQDTFSGFLSGGVSLLFSLFYKKNTHIWLARQVACMHKQSPRLDLIMQMLCDTN